MRPKAYAVSGVDLEMGNRVKREVQKFMRSTHSSKVLSRLGEFSGLFRTDFRSMKDPILVSSVDGVGTKLNIAFAMNRHNTIGQDLVNHCINDIAVVGARPLFFLDYLAFSALHPPTFTQIFKGLTKACKASECALIGGETAQMPGMYQPGEYDLAGTIVGVVDRIKMLDNSVIREGDMLIGLASNGLHTNGYSLARTVLFDRVKLSPHSKVPGIKKTLGDELLRVHRNYQPLLASLPPHMLKAAAHITGGGLIDNIPRVLPPGLDAVLETKTWRVPAIFKLIEKEGGVAREEMFQVFNMGIGMALIVSKKIAPVIIQMTQGQVIGRIVSGSGIVRLC